LSRPFAPNRVKPSRSGGFETAGETAVSTPPLLEASTSRQVMEQRPTPGFRRTMAGIEKIVLLHAKEIKHPQPKKAVRIALQLVSLALKERIRPSDKLRGAALSAEDLRLELTRMFLGYLGSR